MSRGTLRLTLSVLAAAWLGVQAGAMDVAAPTDMAPTPVSGSAGASLTGAVGGISIVPTLSAGLGAPLTGPIMAAPSAFPAALAASPLAAAPAASAERAPLAAAAPGASAHAALPALPAAFVPAAALNADAKSSAFNAANPIFSPPSDSVLRTGKSDVLGLEGIRRTGPGSLRIGSLDDSKLKWIFEGAKSNRASTVEPEPQPVRVSDFQVPAGKWDYFFGRVKPRIVEGMSKADIKKQTHNADRSAQIARILAENGIKDNPAGRVRVMTLFHEAASAATLRAVASDRGVAFIKPAELPTATLEVSFYYAKDADGRDDFDAPAIVTSIIPKEH